MTTTPDTHGESKTTFTDPPKTKKDFTLSDKSHLGNDKRRSEGRKENARGGTLATPKQNLE